MDSYSSVRQEGDRALLISPQVTNLDGKILVFTIFIRDTTSGLRLLAATGNAASGAFDEIPYNMTDKRNKWVEEKVQLPTGIYRILFEATTGSSFSPDLALDYIRLVNGSIGEALDFQPTGNVLNSCVVIISLTVVSSI